MPERDEVREDVAHPALEVDGQLEGAGGKLRLKLQPEHSHARGEQSLDVGEAETPAPHDHAVDALAQQHPDLPLRQLVLLGRRADQHAQPRPLRGKLHTLDEVGVERIPQIPDDDGDGVRLPRSQALRHVVDLVAEILHRAPYAFRGLLAGIPHAVDDARHRGERHTGASRNIDHGHPLVRARGAHAISPDQERRWSIPATPPSRPASLRQAGLTAR